MATSKFKKEKTDLSNTKSFLKEDGEPAELINIPANGILLSRDNSIDVVFGEGFRYTRYGVLFDDGKKITKESAIEIAKQISLIESSLQWILGDILAEALVSGNEEDETITYCSIADATKYTEGTLRSFVMTARTFAYDDRQHEGLSFKHYRLIASNRDYTPRKRRTALNLCVKHEWSTSQLEEYLKSNEIPSTVKKTPLDKVSDAGMKYRSKLERLFISKKIDSDDVLEEIENQIQELADLRSRLQSLVDE